MVSLASVISSVLIVSVVCAFLVVTGTAEAVDSVVRVVGSVVVFSTEVWTSSVVCIAVMV